MVCVCVGGGTLKFVFIVNLTEVSLFVSISILRRYSGGLNLDVQKMPEKDVFWSNCLHLKETKIRRSTKTKNRHEMEVLWTLLSNFQTFRVRPNTVVMCVTALTVVMLLLIVETLPAC